MAQLLSQIALVVKDYEEALKFYTEKLHFELIEDTKLSDVKRWVVITPPGSNGNGCRLLLAQASNDEQAASIGNQTGGRVFLFMYTADLEGDHANLLKHNVEIVRPISHHDYGSVLVFADLYGNLWDLIQPK